MVICPIARIAGCKKCPVFKICPVTTTLGDQKAPEENASKPAKEATSRNTKKR